MAPLNPNAPAWAPPGPTASRGLNVPEPRPHSRERDARAPAQGLGSGHQSPPAKMPPSAAEPPPSPGGDADFTFDEVFERERSVSTSSPRSVRNAVYRGAGGEARGEKSRHRSLRPPPPNAPHVAFRIRRWTRGR